MKSSLLKVFWLTSLTMSAIAGCLLSSWQTQALAQSLSTTLADSTLALQPDSEANRDRLPSETDFASANPIRLASEITSVHQIAAPAAPSGTPLITLGSHLASLNLQSTPAKVLATGLKSAQTVTGSPTPTRSSRQITLEQAIAQATISPSTSALASPPPASQTTVASIASVAELSTASAADSMAQVTSVSQLSDVRPTDWAFQALQSLVERYGCIVGYPDKTFRGDRALTRYEFAAGLNACLDKIQELIAAATGDFVKKEDLEIVKKLQEEFAAELAALRGRVDALEARTATLGKQQFSTATKLYGQVVMGIQGRSNNTADLNPRNGIRDTPDPATNFTFGYNAQLSLVSSFSARDLLLIGLQAGNISTSARFANPPYFLNDSYTRLGYELDTGNSLRLSDLTYRLLVSDKLAVIVGAQGVSPVTVFRGPNRYESSGQGPISAFAQRNPILSLGNTQSGAGFDWQISNWASLQAVYSAGNGFGQASDPAAGAGLFNGPYTAGAQLSLTPIRRVDLSIYYLNSYSTNALLNIGVGDDLIGFVGSRFNTNAVGATIAWRVNPGVTLGGWFGYTNSTVKVPGFRGNVETTNWMVFLNFPDLFKKGNLGGIYVGQPPKIISSDLRQNGIATLNIPSAISGTGGIAGGQPSTTIHAEAFYRFRLSDNISMTPGVIVLFNPVQTGGSDPIVIGTLRTTFTF